MEGLRLFRHIPLLSEPTQLERPLLLSGALEKSWKRKLSERNNFCSFIRMPSLRSVSRNSIFEAPRLPPAYPWKPPLLHSRPTERSCKEMVAVNYVFAVDQLASRFVTTIASTPCHKQTSPLIREVR